MTKTSQIKTYGPISNKINAMLHGGDYNPDQWTSDIWDEDMRLMKLAGCNAMSVGIFAWSALEPTEGQFNFDWLDRIMDMLADNNAYAVLATPTGARPAWMSHKYPQVLRVAPNRVRNLHGQRHNHCPSSPIYREKATIINTMLAERYKDHPALILWHASNEYGGECHCQLCQRAFRKWLQNRYESLDAVNHAWWTTFWSHQFSSFSQIESPSPHGEPRLHGLNLDWRRFVTDITIDFFKHESAPLRKITPDIPVTTNLMGLYPPLDYREIAKHLDVVSWDSYPSWHKHDLVDWQVASDTAFAHDLNRSLKHGKPFMLMESVPSATNWIEHAKVKRPGMHKTSSLQAVAHGSDTVQYFQWRKSRGSVEKFHGAVVDHCGHENTRVFRDVAEVGTSLAKLSQVVGAARPSDVAIIYDWPNRWAIEDAWGPKQSADKNGQKKFVETCLSHYRSFWKMSAGVDIIGQQDDFCSDKYKIIVAPMMYMVYEQTAAKLEKFVRSGGTLVTTFLTGIVNETDLCFLGGWPGPLRELLGIWVEEIDSLHPSESNAIVMADDNPLGFGGKFKATDYFDLLHCETAKPLGVYESDFYAGRPALTVNSFGKGSVYHIAANVGEDFLDKFYAKLAGDCDINLAIQTDLPLGVSASVRTDGQKDFVFVMNFTNQSQPVSLDGADYTDMESGENVPQEISLAPCQARILERKSVFI